MGLALCAAQLASAQTTGLGEARGMDPVSFKPSQSQDSFLTMEGLSRGEAGRFQLRTGLDLATGLMSLKIGSVKQGNLIKRQLALQLGVSYQARPNLEFSLSLPLVLNQGNDFKLLQEAIGFTDAHPAHAGVGDLRVSGRYLFWDPVKRPIGLAAKLELQGITGETESFLGERGVALTPMAQIEWHALEAFRLVGELGYRYRTRPGRYLNLYQGDELLIGVGGALRLPTIRTIRAFRKIKTTAYAELRLASPARAPFTFAAADALKTPLELFLGASAELTPTLSVSLGLGRGLAATTGFGREAFRLFASLAWRSVVPPAPEPAACDRDQDGIPDSLDHCATLPGLAEYEGCPDTDQDEIPDPEDACPQQAGPADQKGCPVKGELARFEGSKIVLLGSVRFATSMASLKDKHSPVLDAVAKILMQHPELRRVRVDGHTDSQGSAAFNQTLSQQRSSTVMLYLVAQGVAAARLESKGFGEMKPIADNGSALGRARNRRVAFTLLDEAPRAASTPSPQSAPKAAPHNRP